MTGLVDHDAFRGALGRFASGVTVVSTIHDGIDHAMTASAFTSVSLDPPLVLVCTHKSSRFHDAVVASGVWGVSILSEQGKEASAWFAHRGRDLATQFDDVDHHRGASGVALIDHSLAWLECTTHQAIDGGDHTILIGAVTAAAVASDQAGVCPDNPLLYYRSHYGTIVRLDENEKSVFREHHD